MRRIRLNLDCAAVCRATGEILMRQTETNERIRRAMLQACQTACEQCGQECEKHGEKMEHCKVCAESCRRCADACRQLVA